MGKTAPLILSIMVLSFFFLLITPVAGTISPAACAPPQVRSATETPAGGIEEINPSDTPRSDWLTGWGKRVRLTIDRNKIDEPLIDFPVLLHIGPSSGANGVDLSFIFDELDSIDKRTRFAITTEDGKTQCYAEIEEWDYPAKEAWLWVKIPHIESHKNTILYLYFDGNAPNNIAYIGDTGTETAHNVWEDTFVMVQHLGVNGKGTPGEFKDSTRRHIDGVGGSGPYTAPKRAPGKIGSGQDFNGINTYIEIPDRDELSIDTTGEITISGWMSPAALNFTNSKEYIRWMGKGDQGQAEYHLRIYNQNTIAISSTGNRANWISFYAFSPQGGLGAGGGGPVGHALKPDEWIYFSASTDMVRSYMGFNGNPGRVADLWRDFNIQYVNGTDPLRIGTSAFALDDWWHGRLDEIRISNVCRSDAWASASYYSESDKLLIYPVPSPEAPAESPEAFDSKQIYAVIAVIVLAAIIAGIVIFLRSRNLRR